MEAPFLSATPSRGQKATSQVPTKRRRIQTACNICQDRKTRCDGTRPACSSCTRRGVAAECVYDSSSVAPAQSSLVSLEQRLGRLEQMGTTTADTPGPRPETAEIPQNNSTCSLGQRCYASAEPSSIGGLTPSKQDTSDVDGLATVSSINDSETLYGASSTIALVRFFHHEAGGQDTEKRSSVPGPARLPIVPPEPIREEDLSMALYPPRRTADDFIRCFWEFAHPLYPVLHRTSFMDRYEQLWSGEHESQSDQAYMDEVIFSSTLNIVFAIGCQFSNLVPAKGKTPMAQDFYQRSRRIYRFEILDSMSIPLVQMLVLTGVYLQSTQQANRCWNVVGLAIRVAQTLGLHFDPKRQAQNQMDREMRLRIWHSCVILDRLLSMTFGRPAMISTKWNVPLPSLIDDEYLRVEGEGSQPPDLPPRLGLLVSSSKLFVILDDILSTFYATHPENNPTAIAENDLRVEEIISDIISLNRRLEKFLSQVPDYLQFTGSQDPSSPHATDKSVTIQTQILHCRYLYVRILLLRPMLHLATQFPRRILSEPTKANSSTMDDHLVRRFCNLCVATACQLIDSIHQNLESNYRSSGWHSVYFTFAAAVILLCAHICPAVDADTIKASFEPSWDQCQAILEHYREQVQSARQAIQALQALRSRINLRIQESTDLSALPSQHHQTAQMDFMQFNIPGIEPGLEAWLDQSLNGHWWGFH